MNDIAYEQLLSSAPGSCADIRRELEQIHGLKFVPGSTYRTLWKRLVEAFGSDGAVTAVEDIVDIRSKRKVLTRVMGKRGKVLIDSIMTKQINAAAKRGRLQLRKNAQASVETQPSAPNISRRKRILKHDHVSLPSTPYGAGPFTARALTYHPIEKATDRSKAPLRGRSDWLEKNLENYLVNQWRELDFALGRQLTLVGRQVNLGTSTEKVDLLAEMDEIVLPIELKIKRAGGSDLTQLQSYRQDIINRGKAPENVLGILVAPQFSSKVLNVVSGSPGIILRWFELPL